MTSIDGKAEAVYNMILETQQTCKSCGTSFTVKPEHIQHKNHPNGVPDRDGNKWWIYFVCPNPDCFKEHGYDWWCDKNTYKRKKEYFQ